MYIRIFDIMFMTFSDVSVSSINFSSYFLLNESHTVENCVFHCIGLSAVNAVVILHYGYSFQICVERAMACQKLYDQVMGSFIFALNHSLTCEINLLVHWVLFWRLFHSDCHLA